MIAKTVRRGGSIWMFGGLIQDTVENSFLVHRTSRFTSSALTFVP